MRGRPQTLCNGVRLGGMDTGVFMCGVDDEMVIIVQAEIENGESASCEKTGAKKKPLSRKQFFFVVSVVVCLLLRCLLRLLV